MKAGKGTLSADVHSDGDRREAVPLITFTAKDFAPKDGLAVLTEAPATLTADGAKAFGSLYRAGTAMDPVSLAVAVDAGAELPALPDLGSAPDPSSEPSAPATEKATPAAAAAADSSTGLYLGLGGGVLVAAAGALYLARRRGTRRTTE